MKQNFSEGETNWNEMIVRKDVAIDIILLSLKRFMGTRGKASIWKI